MPRWASVVALSMCLCAWAAQAGVVGAGMLWAGDFGRSVYSIDLDSGAATHRVDVDVGSSVINDLAFDRGTGLLYGIAGGFGMPNTLFTIDLRTPSLDVRLLGTVTAPTHNLNPHVTGLAFVGAQLVGAASDGLNDVLFSIDLADLSVGAIQGLPAPANFNIQDLATSADAGAVLALQALPVNIFKIGVPSGSVAVVAGTEAVEFQYGLAWVPERNALFTAGEDRTIWVVDPQTMSFRDYSSVPLVGGGGIAALEYVPSSPVPEPGSLGLLIIGTAIVAGRRIFAAQTGIVEA